MGANERLNALEKSQKDRCDSLLGEMKALLVSKTYATREDLSRSIKTIPIGLSKEEIAEMIRDSQTQLNLKIDMIPTPLQKNEVAQMIERSAKSVPAPIKKEEVIQMIERSTSNFLRTVHAETANCVEKNQDCEDFVKKEIEKIKKASVDADQMMKREMKQLSEHTEKSLKEATRSWTTL